MEICMTLKCNEFSWFRNHSKYLMVCPGFTTALMCHKNWSNFSCYVLYLCVFRSLRQDSPDAEWQAAEEEEDDNQKEHPQPLLQRVFQFRSAIRTNPGNSGFFFFLLVLKLNTKKAMANSMQIAIFIIVIKD